MLDVICRYRPFSAARPIFLAAAARTGRPVNVKKGQFVAPTDMSQVVGKLRAAGARAIWLTERGASFGYHNLVVDMRAIPAMRFLGCPVVMDATHSVQQPGGLGASSGGDRSLVPTMARAGVAAGASAVFLEVHPDPDQALCDGPNSLRLDKVEALLHKLQQLYALIIRED